MSSSSSDVDGAESLPLVPVLLSFSEMNQWAALAASMATALVEEESKSAAAGDLSVNPLAPKVARLQSLISAHGSIFKSTTGFFLSEWERLCQRVVPVLEISARSTGDLKQKPGRPTKLNAPERLLSFVLYCKHNTGVRYESSSWNYSRTSLSDDAVYIASVLNVALGDEIRWPNHEQRQQFSQRLAEFPGCIGHVDGTLCRINRPRIAEHKRYYNNRKKMYCFNNVVIVDHDGLFIYVDAGFAGSFHDVRCLRNSHLHHNWRDYFTNDDLDTVQEYVLGDPGYMGVEMYVLRRVDNREMPNADENPVVGAFNQRHASRRVEVEWGIGGLKNKFRRFLTQCPNRRNRFALLFEACARLTNFIHRSRSDYSSTFHGEIDESGIHEGFVNDWA
jgi:DDE superfamily endonuclease